MVRFVKLTALLVWGFSAFALHGEELPEQKAMQLLPLSDDVWLHLSYKQVDGFGLVESNGVIILSEQGSIIIDTPWTEQDTAELLNWAAARGMPVTTSFSSHSHEDRTAGIGLLNSKGIATHASKMTNAILEEQGKPLAKQEITGPTYALAEGVEVFYPGPGHAPDNSVVWLAGANILVGGCLIRSAETDSLGYTGDASPEEWGPSVQKVLARYPEAKIVLPGHGLPGTRALLHHTISLTEGGS